MKWSRVPFRCSFFLPPLLCSIEGEEASGQQIVHEPLSRMEVGSFARQSTRVDRIRLQESPNLASNWRHLSIQMKQFARHYLLNNGRRLLWLRAPLHPWGANWHRGGANKTVAFPSVERKSAWNESITSLPSSIILIKVRTSKNANFHMLCTTIRLMGSYLILHYQQPQQLSASSSPLLLPSVVYLTVVVAFSNAPSNPWWKI